MIPRVAPRFARGAASRLRREERGITVVEGIVAALLLTLGALGVLQVFDSSTRNNYRAEESQVVNNRLQAELEQIRQLPYAEIAMTDYPNSSGDGNDPRWRVSGTTFAVDREAAAGSNQELVVNGAATPDGEGTVSGGVVQPGPEPFTTGDVSGEIHRFVTWTDDPECPECGDGVVKRVTVAAKVTEAPVSFERAFQEVQTDVVDPDLAPDVNPAPPGEEDEGNVAEFWLTDTSCDHETRQPITASHPAHNTRGRCANGLQTADTRGAPDLMFTEAPAIDPGFPPTGQPLFDYATDAVGSDDGVGLTVPSLDGCELESALGASAARALRERTLPPLAAEPGPDDGLLAAPGDHDNEHLRVHTWLSPPAADDGGVLVGEGVLDLWSRTVDASIHPGEICATLFVRQAMEVPWDDGQEVGVAEIEVDIPMGNVGPLTNHNGFVCDRGSGEPHFRCSTNAWPSAWSKVSLPMEFADFDASGGEIPATLPPEARVGLALAVPVSGTDPGQGLELMYDHVDFESRLQLETESLLCLGPPESCPD